MAKREAEFSIEELDRMYDGAMEEPRIPAEENGTQKGTNEQERGEVIRI